MNEKALRQLQNSKSGEHLKDFPFSRHKEKEKSENSGQLQLQYLRNLKDQNKTKRFNEDLKSEYSHVLSLSKAKKPQVQNFNPSDDQKSKHRLTSDALSKI